MTIGSRGRDDDIATLVAKKQYSKAIEIIRAQLHAKGADQRMRLQLGDILVMAGRPRDAVAVLLPLADEYARDGFAAKAISVLKKIQKIDPRREVEQRLATLIEEKQRVATVPLPSPTRFFEIGIEEIGDGEDLEIGIGGAGVSVSAPEPAPVFDHDLLTEEGSDVAVAAPLPPPAPAAARRPPARETPAPSRRVEPPAARAKPPQTEREISLQAGPDFAFEAEPLDLAIDAEPLEIGVPVRIPKPKAKAITPLAPAVKAPEITLEAELLEIEAHDLELEAEPIEVEPLPAEPETTAPDPMSDDLFAQELLSALDEAFPPNLGQPAPAPAARPSPAGGGGTQIVVSPLFKDFSVDELVAVIQGLRLLVHEPGDVILNEGEPGSSLYMLAAGKVKVFRKNASGRSALVGELSEGAFFGEGSILTGRPRNATVIAAARCELLELDRATLDSITKPHPRVWDILREFAAKRTS
jgi:hypothetical protein